MESRTILLVGKKCIQCHICEIVCPTKSIVFHANNKGFIVPYITSKCINCGKCLSSCPTIEFNKKDFLTTRPIRTIYGYSNDTINLFESSSGGIFYILAKKAASLGFDIISTVYSDNFRSCYYSSSTESTIEQMRQSKYCESNFSNVLERVSKNLKNNKRTLICGTPCHINALRQYFGSNTNLLLVDFVCHGVPSTKVFNDMIDYYEKKLHSKITQLNFRFKKTKYSNSLVLLISNGKKHIIVPWYSDRFYYAFEKYWILRDSCYFCDFIDKHSSDITLGDFWDGSKAGINANNKIGCSLVFLNTKNGEGMMDLVSNELNFHELSSYNSYSTPHKKNSDYNKQVLFFEMYKNDGFVKTSDYLFFKKQKIKNSIKKIFQLVKKK